MQINPYFKACQEVFTEIRHDLHAHPETAFEEIRTAETVAGYLREWGYEPVTQVGETGVVATYRNGAGGVIGLRADMDALDLQELNDFSHRSTIPGKMHACGHDGHTTMLLAAARYMAEHSPCQGTVHFIFQPAEENEGGAPRMIEDGLFERFPVDQVFGMHNFPGIPVGQFAVRPGPLMAAFEIFDITVRGIGGHGAMPHLSRDPVVASAALVSSLQTIVSRNLDPLRNRVLSVTRINGGSAYNIIPEEVKLAGSLRYFEDVDGDLLRDRIQAVCDGIASAHDVRIDVKFDARYVSLVNERAATAVAVETMQSIVGDTNVDANTTPIMGSEDFAFMLKEKPGCYVLIGNGTEGSGGCMVHNPRYDFNDEIIPLGATYWVELCKRIMGTCA